MKYTFLLMICILCISCSWQKDENLYNLTEPQPVDVIWWPAEGAWTTETMRISGWKFNQ